MKIDFKTHTFRYQYDNGLLSIDVFINDAIYLEMQISSRACEFADTIKNHNNRVLLNALSFFGVEPNLEYLFKPTPIENERYLIYRFIKSIFQEDYQHLHQFSSDWEYRKFCAEANVQYESQVWFKRIYIDDTLNNALSYITKQSLIFQELYFPTSSSYFCPSLHDVERHKNVYAFKNDFMKIFDIIRNNNINCLYHFTDKRNIQSIKQSGGLLSQEEIDGKNIYPIYSSSEDSRANDNRQGLSDYVRLSFVKGHPMMYTAMTCGRITSPRIIEINPLVLLLPGVLYSDRNALKNGAIIGSDAKALSNIQFNLFSQNYLSLIDSDSRSHYQAEILVPKRVGCEFFLNFNDL